MLLKAQIFSKFEYSVNLTIGIILLLNLYLLSGFLSIQYAFILIPCFLISCFFFIKRFNRNVFVNLINNWNVFFFVVFSIFLSLFTYLVSDLKYELKFNDAIRVIIYSIYLSWTAFIYYGKKELNLFIFKIAAISLFILLLEGILESSDPFLFAMLLSENVSKTISRVGGTLADPNAYSNAVIVFSFFILYFLPNVKFYLKLFISILIFFVVFYLVELSGSRQGLISMLVLLFYFVPILIERYSLKSKMIALGTILVIFMLCLPLIYSYLINNPESSLTRVIFSSDNPKSVNSNLEREESLVAGFNFLKSNLFLIGPGMLYFDDAWQQFVKVNVPFPHNSFLFIFCQFGMLSFFILYMMIKTFKRAMIIKYWPLLLITAIQLFLLANPIYYAIHFFTLFVIDMSWMETKIAKTA